MTELIKFNPVDSLSELTVNPPQPAIEYLPEWYKKAMPFYTPKPEFDFDTGRPNPTFKMCMPLLDSFSLGYIQETWCDIYIERKDDVVTFYYAAGPKIMSQRASKVGDSFPHFDGFLTAHYSWHPPWFPEVPQGYSCLITHPMNHDDLPFRTFAGVIDCDGFSQSEVASNLPFILKENFTGMIKKGTPMYQIIPFKRQSWQSIATEHDVKKQMKVSQSIKQYMWGGYKKLFWNKKEFK